MTRLFKLAAGMGQPSSRYARLGQAHTGDLQKRRYTNYMGGKLNRLPFLCSLSFFSIFGGKDVNE